jgi:hypothetical protein
LYSQIYVRSHVLEIANRGLALDVRVKQIFRIIISLIIVSMVFTLSKTIMRLSIVVFASYVGLGSRVLLCYSLLDDFDDDALCD